MSISVFEDIELKPFIKWAGGKKRVIQNHLKKYLPNQFKRYIEPFLGGGAMLAYLKPKQAIVSDLNSELIQSYIYIYI